MNKGEEAMEEFKLVYSADISFRDVADKINTFTITNLMAERGGFEPRYLAAHPISSRAHSTTLPPLLENCKRLHQCVKNGKINSLQLWFAKFILSS